MPKKKEEFPDYLPPTVHMLEDYEHYVLDQLGTREGYNTREHAGTFSLRALYIGIDLAMRHPEVAKALMAEMDKDVPMPDEVRRQHEAQLRAIVAKDCEPYHRSQEVVEEKQRVH